MVKIITWNVNGIRSVQRKGGLIRLVDEHEPDILFLQETKCHESDIANIPGYIMSAESSVRPGRHGVATFLKIQFVEEVLNDAYIFEGPEDDPENNNNLNDHNIDPSIGSQGRESRIQVMPAYLNDRYLVFINVYAVNSRRDLSRLPERKEFDDHVAYLVNFYKTKYGEDSYIFVAGDLNVVSDPIDYHGTMSEYQSGMTDQERNSLKDLCKRYELVDTFRHANPDTEAFSWWSYIANARSRNLGWRIDYILASRKAVDGIRSASILDNYFDSDHAPMILEIDL